MYIALSCSFPVSGHMCSKRALSKVMYHTAHCLSAIFMIFLHLLMTLVAHVNSCFACFYVAFKVANQQLQACMQTHWCIFIQVRLQLAYHIWQFHQLQPLPHRHCLEVLHAHQMISLNLENWTMLHAAHWRCSGTSQNLNIPHHASIAQENDEQLTCNAIMGCCTI